jgi:superfamily II DNA or RNA helicase
VLIKNRAVCIQGATGSGKTPVMAAMCESVVAKKKRAWIVVNRKELLGQASAHLRKWNVPHGIIAPNMQESRAYSVHVVSKDTLIRRYDKIKNFPDLLIFDEAHLYLDRQIEIISHLPEQSKIIGMTATPERLDGRGLSEVYNDLIEGPSIPELTAGHFLSPLRYFSPPIEGLQDLHVRGTDYDEEELESLLERRKVYGEVVGHYEKYGRGKPTLGFCRSVKSAYQMADRFKDKGFNFHCIEGKMSDGKRKDLIIALTVGNIDGLTGCDIFLYGLDIPRVEYGFTVRPTLSRAVYMQSIGRILRPFKDEKTGYEKHEALFFDHVNNILEHQDLNYPGVPLHYVPKIDWNFYGSEKRKRKKDENNIRLCPLMDFMYCAKPSCRNCEHNPDKQLADARKPMIVIPADLEEIKHPVSMAELPPEERREWQDRIGKCVLEYKTTQAPSAVSELLKIAELRGYSIFWVYHRLNDDEKKAVNVPLLAAIGKCKGFKPGWVWYAKKHIHAENENKKEYEDVING